MVPVVVRVCQAGWGVGGVEGVVVVGVVKLVH